MQSPCFMESTVVEDQYFELIGSVCVQTIEIGLKAICIARGQFQCIVIAVYWSIGAKQIEVLKPVLISNDWLYASCSKASALYGQQPKAAFIHDIKGNSSTTGLLKLLVLNMS